jgi:hypothetical protein
MPLPDFTKIGREVGKLRCYVVDGGEIQNMDWVLSSN